MAQHALHYRDVGPEGLDRVRPLWERLRDHHAALPGWAFAEEVARATFADRRRELLDKSRGGALRVELVSAGDTAPIGYCVTSISASGAGEVDSMFVESSWRGHGVGTELVRRALAWLGEQGATSKSVAVAYDNLPATAFYRRLGFVPRTVRMEHRAGHAGQ
jgi:GNAT superfamily N-acetyltransferase